MSCSNSTVCGVRSDPIQIRNNIADKSEHTDRTKFWNRLRIRPLYGDDGKVMFYAGAQNPIDVKDVRDGFIESIED